MPVLFIPFLALFAGLCGLIWGADKFVNGSVGIARSLGISSLVIGLTVVSIGTSAPEIIVSINAALDNSGGLAVGNAIGSNLANIGLVLGITALVAPIPVQKHLLYEESPVLLLITALAGLCLYDGQLNRIESIALGILVIPLLIMVVKYKRSHPDVESTKVSSTDIDLSLKYSSLWLFIGLIALLAGAELTVWSAKSVALHFGISDLVIGLTVVAIGTSLPELAASVMSAKRGHHDIAIGNIFGSNLFNLLLVMTAAGMISPIALSSDVFTRDYLALAAMTLLLVAIVAFALLKGRGKPGGAFVSRVIGVVLLSAYCSYYIVLWPSMVVS
ncbi:MAG: Inner membrane protein YrbG [Porticoccaceae bacterium UBA1117]|nr:calcium/sodium antiporter [Porticoccaceae bacterium]CAI8328649.1 MAG: Inner membrane protein YrbG [Porticoccaceae bacterium UBA1117]